MSGATGVLILDEDNGASLTLSRSFSRLGLPTVLTGDLQEARAACEPRLPSLVVTELRVERRWAFDFIPELLGSARRCPVVIATDYPSVATALRAGRTGFAAYLNKPVIAPTILDIVQPRSPSQLAKGIPDCWPSLDRTIWEYINQVYLAAGTMSEAARRLGLDRKSLRRMLAKYPPAH